MEYLLFWWPAMGVVGYFIGAGRGHGAAGFWLGFLLGPIGWIITLLAWQHQPQVVILRQGESITEPPPPPRSSGGGVALVLVLVIGGGIGAVYLKQKMEHDGPGLSEWRASYQACFAKMDQAGEIERAARTTPMTAGEGAEAFRTALRLRIEAEYELADVLKSKPSPLSADEAGTLRQAESFIAKHEAEERAAQATRRPAVEPPRPHVETVGLTTRVGPNTYIAKPTDPRPAQKSASDVQAEILRKYGATK